MSGPIYTRDILRLAAAIPHSVRFEEVGEQDEMRSPTCGSRVRIGVELDPNGRVESLVQAVEACAFGQAAAALMGAEAIGKNEQQAAESIRKISAWLAGDDRAANAWPGLAVLDPARSRRGRHGAILLPFRALLAAIERG